MRKVFQFRSRVVRLVVLTGGMLLGLTITGCSENAPKREIAVTSPVGHSSVCAHCNKKIETVSEENLVTIEGIQYIICDEKCSAKLKKWVAKQ